MSTRRRRALGSAISAVLLAALCALLSANVDGLQRAVLLVLTVAWLVIAATCVARMLRTEPSVAVAADDEGSHDAT
jgi:hypothetical protein